ncbi:MAG TPA: hypothetical protein VMV93_07390 [Chloroflexota bacterium]|nr:hypothetical protein [Chloroflexota bacterium]
MEYYRPPQDESRFYAWVNATHWLDEIEPDLLKSWVQGMAHLDAQLWLREDLAHQGRITGEIVHELSDRQTLSNLWVLGMYELLRTLKGLRDHPVSDDRGKKVNRGFEVTEHALELLRPNSSRLDQAEEHCRRIRIVLAKMECHGNTQVTPAWLFQR